RARGGKLASVPLPSRRGGISGRATRPADVAHRRRLARARGRGRGALPARARRRPWASERDQRALAGSDGLDASFAGGRGVPGPQADHRAGPNGLADRRTALADPRRRAARFLTEALEVWLRR